MISVGDKYLECNGKRFEIGDKITVIFIKGYFPLLRSKGLNGYHAILRGIDVKLNRLTVDLIDSINVTQYAPVDKIEKIEAY